MMANIKADPLLTQQKPEKEVRAKKKKERAAKRKISVKLRREELEELRKNVSKYSRRHVKIIVSGKLTQTTNNFQPLSGSIRRR